jgi:hypothetical protein
VKANVNANANVNAVARAGVEVGARVVGSRRDATKIASLVFLNHSCL